MEFSTEVEIVPQRTGRRLSCLQTIAQTREGRSAQTTTAAHQKWRNAIVLARPNEFNGHKTHENKD